MSKARIGILGGGNILGAHAPGFRAGEDRAEVVAVAEIDPSSEKKQRIYDLLGHEVEIHEGYEELLNNADVDAVDILLPHHLHMPATIAAAEKGKHVLIEKVMARNVWECDRMIEACDKAGVTLTVCHDRRYNPQWGALKRVVDSGILGEVLYWKLEHNQDVDPIAFDIRWIADADQLGGGAIMSCLTHQIDALRWYNGEVDSVTCKTKILPERMAGESIAVLAAQMKSGALAQLSINWVTRSGTDTLRADEIPADPNALWYEMVQVCGVKGEAYYLAGRGTFVLCRDGSDPRDRIECEDPALENGFAEVKTEQGGGHPRCVDEWINLISGRETHIITSGRDVRGTVEVAEAAYVSARSGTHVTLPIEPQQWQSWK